VKTYKAYATMSVDLVCEFQIPEGEDPWQYAKYEIDGGDFKQIDGSGDWKLFEVTELEAVK